MSCVPGGSRSSRTSAHIFASVGPRPAGRDYDCDASRQLIRLCLLAHQTMLPDHSIAGKTHPSPLRRPEEEGGYTIVS